MKVRLTLDLDIPDEMDPELITNSDLRRESIMQNYIEFVRLAHASRVTTWTVSRSIYESAGDDMMLKLAQDSIAHHSDWASICESVEVAQLMKLD